jgi:hypothetical protein
MPKRSACQRATASGSAAGHPVAEFFVGAAKTEAAARASMQIRAFVFIGKRKYNGCEMLSCN